MVPTEPLASVPPFGHLWWRCGHEAGSSLASVLFWPVAIAQIRRCLDPTSTGPNSIPYPPILFVYKFWVKFFGKVVMFFAKRCYTGFSEMHLWAKDLYHLSDTIIEIANKNSLSCIRSQTWWSPPCSGQEISSWNLISLWLLFRTDFPSL